MLRGRDQIPSSRDLPPVDRRHDESGRVGCTGDGVAPRIAHHRAAVAGTFFTVGYGAAGLSASNETGLRFGGALPRQDFTMFLAGL